ncbi:PRD domain-containing protein [Clostridium sp. FP2]|uniref:glucose PTS transporter transcription antiterminator GlcT n=1 Tax=Clostridium TaxID=1485 RepID=UPI0013E9415B|nr:MULTISPECIES: PRD domain-containing protein [Clostridium]MBW9156715.1 PRD domain-containing protein [Clostridium tagluense]MBZ9625082.1 PRD domain-containing protein [Clostridium sp. FP2]WLC64873.1 PRD domain-containing protein [Clostridium tagluense]
MNFLFKADYTIQKVFNNNVLLVTQKNSEKILFGKGLGFGKHFGDILSSKTEIDKIFSLDDKTNYHNFKELVTTVDNELIGLCEEIIFMISKELNEDLNEKIHISLTDHIAFTLKRLKQNDEIINPFLVETETLYKREFEIAKKAVSMLQKKLNIIIPDGEIGFITLHIHSARNNGKLSNTIKYAFLSNSIIELIEDSLDLEIDTGSIDYARFITHIRFAIERLINNTPIRNELIDVIKKQYSDSYTLAQKVCNLLASELQLNVMEDEVAYIAVHIEKFKHAS